MRPWQRAHERLLSRLPVHTHSARHELEPAGGTRQATTVPPGHKAGRAVIYKGKTHKSISAAARDLHVHPRQIYEWLRSGEAAFATARIRRRT